MKIDKAEIVDNLSDRWNRSGLSHGDTFLLHSNLKRLIFEFKRKKIKISVDLIIDSFLNVVGKNGTIIVPLFNFDFINRNVFSIKNTPSQMGILTELFRKKYSSCRTGHPVYSFGVFGKKKKYFENIDNFSAYGEESPFAVLKRFGGKIAILDLEDQDSMTFYHHIEEINNVPWRYNKIFNGLCVDKNGKKKNKEYSIFVRKIDLNVKTNVNPMGDLLWKNGLYKGSKPFEGTGLRVIQSAEMCNFVTEIIKKNKAKGLLYTTS
jgi:aminoglycoside 3-N-acetyltransferase